MNQTTQKKAIRSKKIFKKILLTLLQKKPFDEITITEIVREAEFNRGTFYFHYEQKEDLLEEMIEDVFVELRKAFRHCYLNSDTEVNILELSTIPLFDHFIEYKQFYQVMLGSHITHNFRDQLIESMKKHFREDIDFQANDIDTDINIELFYTYRVSGMIGLILEWIQNDFNHPKTYMAEQIVKIATFYTKKVYIKS
ncbi:TetR/AcrR family transcriptional regulator [Halalkalibacter krulwichiae]|uniref:HTH-type dhaKLM operon transcriptional activator DhaS n=1 Tax=Halalkalibacter krulwichiae TaxID=199441 RepID=A0A1X9M967_9BACI|nr:TetR/AcrR family transcriptional regulator [Halalkalibacter krulwichiae]ARK29955.1 HTH-type dhaKLM operon transcriptional activator DhaS [Halalkalibacter krulwichiae]